MSEMSRHVEAVAFNAIEPIERFNKACADAARVLADVKPEECPYYGTLFDMYVYLLQRDPWQFSDALEETIAGYAEDVRVIMDRMGFPDELIEKQDKPKK